MSALLGGLGPLFARSLVSDICRCVALTALAVGSNCTKHTAKDSDGAALERDALSHGLCLTGTLTLSLDSHVSPAVAVDLCQGRPLEVAK